MKLPRQPHNTSTLADFFQESLEALGAVTERTWHNRLHLVAEGAPARLWHPDGALHEVELHFPPPDEVAPREAGREVFPGCPLTFRLAEALRPSPVPLEKAVLPPPLGHRLPAPEVLDKLWHAQHPGTQRWRLAAPPAPAHHFSLLLLVRCEIQAIDQHWSLHRLAVSLSSGASDDALAAELGFLSLDPNPRNPVDWPRPDPVRWRDLAQSALRREIEDDLAVIRQRQTAHLRREIERIDTYFQGYEEELTARRQRSHSDSSKLKVAERLAAARDEHARRRADQLQRHEIRVLPQVDALMLLAEPAWRATVSFWKDNAAHTLESLFVPRTRHWMTDAP